MNQVLRQLWLWVWHLLPANPILVRVVHGASRRPRHLWLRATYLAALIFVVLLSLFPSLSGKSGSLTELAKGASTTFMWASTTQLALMCFLAPVFTAAAITQERDAQTFNILLSTPLTNAQIVFGSLISRLYFVIVLLVAGLPIFLMTMVYGGVTTSQVVESFALSAATAILTGALAIFVAMMGVGTRRTIFSFYLLIGLYLLGVYLLGRLWDGSWVAESATNLAGRKMSWLTALHPFLSLEVALNQVYAPSFSHLADRSALARYALAYPSATYVGWTLTLALVLTVVSIIFVRRGAKVGEPTIFSALFDRFRRTPRGERTRKPRSVWANPVAWREARTRATEGRVLRWAIIIAGLVACLTLLIYHLGGTLPAAQVRVWLAAIILVLFAIALLIATNTAATSMTKEKESKSMDLLLSTPLTSKYILWGKLRGLVSFAIPLLAGPVLVLFVFGVCGLFGKDSPPVVWIETFLLVAVLMVTYTACACVIALSVSLKSKKTVSAVMYSVGLLIVVCGVWSAGGFAFIDAANGPIGAFLAPLSPFTAIKFLVDPAALADNPAAFARQATSIRIASALGTVVAVGAYALLFVWTRYNSLVRNFDMIMRKQTGT